MSMPMIVRLNKSSSDTDYVEVGQGVLSESDLWKAVLTQAISDTALGDGRQQLEVAKWMQTRDFVTVCDFADINDIQIKKEIDNLLTMESRPLRKHYSRILCRTISHRIIKRKKSNGIEVND